MPKQIQAFCENDTCPNYDIDLPLEGPDEPGWIGVVCGPCSTSATSRTKGQPKVRKKPPKGEKVK